MASEPGGMTFVAEECEEGWRCYSYYVDERWVLYEDWHDGTLRPCNLSGLPKIVADFVDAQANVAGRLVPCIDSGAPYRCSGCGTDRLHVCRNGPESMILRCPECGGEGVEVDIA